MDEKWHLSYELWALNCEESVISIWQLHFCPRTVMQCPLSVQFPMSMCLTPWYIKKNEIWTIQLALLTWKCNIDVFICVYLSINEWEHIKLVIFQAILILANSVTLNGLNRQNKLFDYRTISITVYIAAKVIFCSQVKEQYSVNKQTCAESGLSFVMIEQYTLHEQFFHPLGSCQT